MDRKRLSLPDWAIALLFGATILIVTAQVVFRYVLNSSLTWTEELSRYLFTWMIFLGAALALRDGSHIRIELLVERLPRRAVAVLHIVTEAVILVFLVVMVVLGFDLVRRTGGAVSPALSLPVSYAFYASLPVTFALAVYYVVRRAIRAVRGETNAAPPEGNED